MAESILPDGPGRPRVGAIGPGLTVGITTRNRPDSLLRCLESLPALGPGLSEVVVLDDASDPPVEPAVRARIRDRVPVRVIRQETNLGYIVGRNTIVGAAGTDLVLLLDDDTRVGDPDSVWAAVAVLRADPTLAAIAFAQAEADGSAWPAGMQPAPVGYPCYAPTFIGFAHLLRRDLFRRLGGYREAFHYYGEEKEYCLRALDAGHRVAFLPGSLVSHLPDPGGRDQVKYFRYYTRNDCLTALYNLPWPVAVARVLHRVALYHRTFRGHIGGVDPGGRRWLLRELRAAWPDVRRNRRAVRWATLREWQRLKKIWPAYPPAEAK